MKTLNTKLYTFVACTLFFLSFSTINKANDDFDFDDFDFDTIENFEDFDFDAFAATRTPANNQVWSSITPGQLGESLPALVETDFYTRTNKIAYRNPLDYTSSVFQKLYKKEKSRLILHFFLNHAFSKYLTEEGNTLKEYTEIEDEALNDILEKASGGQSAFNIGESLTLFQKAKIQENTLCAMPEWNYFGDRLTVQVKTPLLYTERNAYFTDKEKEAIYNSPLVKYAASSLGMTGTLSDDDEWELARKYFISDQLGIGDTRASFLYRTLSLPTTTLKLGGWIQLPTNIAFARGLLGTWFPVDNKRNPLNLTDIDLTTVQTDGLTKKNIQDLTKFFVGTLTKLNSNLLNPPLGLKDSIGLGLQMELDWAISQRVKTKSSFSAQLFTPKREARFFKQKTNHRFKNIFEIVEPINSSGGMLTQEQSDEYVKALESELVNRFYPHVYHADIFPGFMLHGHTNMYITINDKWNLGLGYDSWWQSAESIRTVYAPDTIRAHLAVDAAEQLSAYQVKPFIQANYHTAHKNHLWNVCIFADATVLQQSIGYDATLGLKLSVDW